MTTPMTDTTTVRVPRALIEQLRVIADAHDRSLSAELRQAIREYVKRNGGR
jgi:predicted transcriptional regulator